MPARKRDFLLGAMLVAASAPSLHAAEARIEETIVTAEKRSASVQETAIAITAFAIQEFVSTLGVVDETPLFFKPLGEVLHEYANSGYIVPN